MNYESSKQNMLILSCRLQSFAKAEVGWQSSDLRIKKKIEGATIKETRSVGTTLHVGGTTHGVSGRAVLLA